MEPIPFHVPSIDEEDIPGVLEVLRNGWVTTGPRCREFEQNFAEYMGGNIHCIAVSSCTAGLHLALEAIGIGPGDKVLTTPFTFTTTGEVIRYLGADPVFVDVHPETFNLDPAAVETALDQPGFEQVKAVLPVHYAGLPCAMDEFERLCSRRGLSLIDDAAHALPTQRAGRLIGRWGDVTAFSFYATKTLCTGEGGMVVTEREDLADRMRVMRLHGISKDVFDRYRSTSPSWYYEVIAPGFKYNLSDIQASLGVSQLARLDRFHRRRSEVAALYDAAFATAEGLATPPRPVDGDTHSWHLYPLRVLDGRETRDAVIEELAAQQISTSVHFIPLHLHPYWKERYGLSPSDYPAANHLFGQELSLPIFPSMTDGQVERVAAAVPEALARARKRVPR